MTVNNHKVIHPPNAEGYYSEWKFSPAIECNGFIFVSGCTGTMSDGTVPKGIRAQTQQAFSKIKSSLDEAGVEFTDIVEMTTYHVELNKHLDEFRAEKERFISEPFPAWTAIGVSELASKGALVEIRVIAKSKIA